MALGTATATSTRARAGIALGCTVAYLLAFLPLDRTLGSGSAIFVSVPVIAAAWLFGVRVGLIAGIAAFLLNNLLYAFVSEFEWSVWITSGGIVGHIATLSLAALVGWLQDSRKSIAAEVTARRQADLLLREREEEASRLAHEAETLANIGRIISSSLDIDEVYERFADQLRLLIPFDRLSIGIPDAEMKLSMLSYLTGAEVADWKVGSRFALEGTLSLATLDSGSSVLLQGVDRGYIEEHLPGSLPNYDSGLRSSLTVPLLHHGDAVAVLQIWSRAENAYTERHVKLADRVAVQIAGAISNAQLYRERAAAESAMRDAEDKYRVLVENANDAIVVLQKGEVVYRNPVFERLLGCSVAETAGRSFLDNVAPVDRERIREYYSSRQKGVAAPEQFEVRLLTRDGKQPTMEAKPVTIEYEGKPATLVVMRDITEREMLQAELLESQKMEAVGRLAGGIAHDFNNLLTPIITYSDMGASRVQTTNPVHGYLQEIGKAGQRGAQLIRQLLAFSRHQVIERKVLDLNQLIFSVDSLLRRLIGEDIELVFLPAQDLPLVDVDPGQVEQVVINLIVNARDAMPGGGRIIIETEDVLRDSRSAMSLPGATGSEFVTVSVRDTGTGIAEEIKEHIFEPFFTTKEPGKGTGLGLSTSYGVVSQLGGHITVDDGPEGGALFKIFLPKAERVPSSDSAGNGRDSFLPGSETVMVVEDEASVLKVVVEALHAQGYAVLEAANGNDALKAIDGYSDGKVDLLITDVVMPLMGGRELADRLSKIHPETKVLFTSGYAGDQLGDVRMRDEGADFLPKPYTMNSLVSKVRLLLGGWIEYPRERGSAPGFARAWMIGAVAPVSRVDRMWYASRVGPSLNSILRVAISANAEVVQRGLIAGRSPGWRTTRIGSSTQSTWFI